MGRGAHSGVEGLDCFERFVGVTRKIAWIIDDVPDHAVSIEDVSDALGHTALLVEDLPGLGRAGPREIAEQGEAEAELLGIGSGGKG